MPPKIEKYREILIAISDMGEVGDKSIEVEHEGMAVMNYLDSQKSVSIHAVDLIKSDGMRYKVRFQEVAEAQSGVRSIKERLSEFSSNPKFIGSHPDNRWSPVASCGGFTLYGNETVWYDYDLIELRPQLNDLLVKFVSNCRNLTTLEDIQEGWISRDVYSPDQRLVGKYVSDLNKKLKNIVGFSPVKKVSRTTWRIEFTK